MGLVVGRREGQRVFVGDTPVEIVSVLGPSKFKVKVTTWRHAIYEITDRQTTEILPNVKLSAGLDGDYETARLHFTAPRTIPIKREEIYEPPGDPAG